MDWVPTPPAASPTPSRYLQVGQSAPRFVHFLHPLDKIAIGTLLLAAFCATWGAMHVGPMQFGDLFLLLSLASISVLVIIGGLRFSVPAWTWFPAVALLILSIIHVVSPIAAISYSGRYQLALYKPGSLVKAGFWLLAILLVPLCIAAATEINERLPQWVSFSFLSGVCVSVGVAISDVSGLTHIAATLGYESITIRQTGLTAHPNTLGVVSIIATPIAVYLAGLQHRLAPAISGLAVVILGAGIVLSGSRGSQALFVPVIVTATLLTPNRKLAFKTMAAAGLAAAAGGVVLFYAVLPPSAQEEFFRFGGNSASASDSDSERSILALQALNDFVGFPIAGLGIKHIADAHSIYLQIISAGGIILTVAMIVFFAGALRNAVRLTKKGVRLGSFLGVSLAAWMIIGTIENQLTDRYLYYTIGCIVALSGHYLHRRQSAAVKDSPVGDAAATDSTVPAAR